MEAVVDLQSILQNSPALCSKQLVLMTVHENKMTGVDPQSDYGGTEYVVTDGSYEVGNEIMIQSVEVVQQASKTGDHSERLVENDGIPFNVSKHGGCENGITCTGNEENAPVTKYVIMKDEMSQCGTQQVAQDFFIDHLDLMTPHEVIIESAEIDCKEEICADIVYRSSCSSVQLKDEGGGDDLRVTFDEGKIDEQVPYVEMDSMTGDGKMVVDAPGVVTSHSNHPQKNIRSEQAQLPGKCSLPLTEQDGSSVQARTCFDSEHLADLQNESITLSEECQPDEVCRMEVASEIEIDTCSGSVVVMRNDDEGIKDSELNATLDPGSGLFLGGECPVPSVNEPTYDGAKPLKARQKLSSIISRVTRSISAKQAIPQNDTRGTGEAPSLSLVSYPCTVCSKSLPLYKLARHVRSHNEAPVSCPCCFLDFDSGQELAKHLVSIHGNKRSLRCTVCEEEFRRPEHLKVHMALHTGEPLYRCSICTAEFNKSHVFYSHLGDHSDEDAPFTCNVCQRLFQEMSRYKSHLRVHDGSTYVKCIKCSKTFFNKTALRDHKMRCHRKQQALSCDECEKSFSNPLSLQKHKLRHTRENTNKRYVCIFCSRTFLDSGSYTRHERLHTEERPFLCSLCGDQFITMGYLNQHLRQKHTANEQQCEKPLPPVISKEHICDICHRSFAAENSLKTHQRQHTGETPYECATCGKKYKQSSNLRDHELLHSGERPFACTLCPKKFTRSGNLTAHVQRVHEGVKKFQCPVCDKPYSQSRSVFSHLEKSHPEVSFERDYIVPVNIKISKKNS